MSALCLALALFAASCREETKVNVASSLHPERMATMSTRDISTLISDSGVTQYRIVAPLWEVYDEVDEPYWRFPEGIYLRKYDRRFNVIATIAADSARYIRNEKLWRLDGNVEITKKPADLFLSQRVFWDQGKGIVYSDTFMHIENADHVLEGTGFVSNENFTSYRVTRPTGIFPAKDPRDQEGPAAPTAPTATSAVSAISAPEVQPPN